MQEIGMSPCIKFMSYPITREELYAISGLHFPDNTPDSVKKEIIGPAMVMMCGPGVKQVVLCHYPDCFFISEFLCDHPTGEGKTCDLPLCRYHRHKVSGKMDLCEIHRLEFREKSGIEKVNPWPPEKGPIVRRLSVGGKDPAKGAE